MPDPRLPRAACVVSDGDDKWEEQLGNEVSKPDPDGFRQANSPNGHEPTDASEEHAESEQVNKGFLLPDGDRRPQVDQS